MGEDEKNRSEIPSDKEPAERILEMLEAMSSRQNSADQLIADLGELLKIIQGEQRNVEITVARRIAKGMSDKAIKLGIRALGELFKRRANAIIKDYEAKQAVINNRLAQLEREIRRDRILGIIIGAALLILIIASRLI